MSGTSLKSTASGFKVVKLPWVWGENLLRKLHEHKEVIWDDSVEALGIDFLITALYGFYVEIVSDRPSAVSLQFLKEMVEILQSSIQKGAKVVDLGSGATSAVLRLYQKYIDPTISVWSVDTDKYWLNRSEMFTKLLGLDTQHFVMWEDLQDSGEGNFDYIIFDINYTGLRLRHLPYTVQHLSKSSSVVVFDDIHKGAYAEMLFKQLSKLTRSFKILDIKEKTLDEFGRWATAITSIMI